MGDELVLAPLSLFFPDMFGMVGPGLTRVQQRNDGDPADPHDDFYLKQVQRTQDPVSNLSHVMRKPGFCICENKVANQLCGSPAAHLQLYFCQINSHSHYFLNPKFQAHGPLLWLYHPVHVVPGRKLQRPALTHHMSFTNELLHDKSNCYCDLKSSAHLSRDVRKPTFWFPTWSDTNQAVQLQKMARGLKFRI